MRSLVAHINLTANHNQIPSRGYDIFNRDLSKPAQQKAFAEDYIHNRNKLKEALEDFRASTISPPGSPLHSPSEWKVPPSELRPPSPRRDPKTLAPLPSYTPKPIKSDKKGRPVVIHNDRL